ncbi:MAG: thymidylate synthase [Candidatus Bathyarchaeota archaeon]|nr:thymidylate synthase [Candidatus Bathyarchaeota archaeon]MDH5494989.1 thymidylate synthase [Candidatus Bathyarchaeota archaeon]
MEYIKISAFDCPDAWYKTLNAIWNKGDIFEVCYGSEYAKTKKLNISIEIAKPETRPLVNDKAPCDMKYVQWYALKYLWSGIIEDETYTYGSRLRKPIDQIEEAIKRYLEEPADRQITLAVRLPEDIMKHINDRKHEPPCLSLIDTEVLEGKLHLTCYFRSWDAYAGLPANIAGIQLLNEAFVSEINRRGTLKLKTGKLVFHSKNCHLYERQFKIVEDLLKPKNDDRRKILRSQNQPK